MQMSDVEALAAQVRTLEAQVGRLQDLQEIKDLHAKYHRLVDKGWGGEVIDHERFSEVFTDDVIWGSAPDSTNVMFAPELRAENRDVYRGIEAVTAMLIKSTDIFDISQHAILNAVYDVSGDTATCYQLNWVCTKQNGDPNLWFLSANTAYRRTPDGWRITQVLLTFTQTLNQTGSAHTRPQS
jgi:hypothetical protein